MTHKIKKMVFTTLFTMGAYWLFAQDDKSTDVLRTRTGNIYFARINASQAKSLKEAPAFLHDFLKAPQGHDFRLTREETDKMGNTHQRYAQYYQGIKIEGAEYLVHGKKGLIETVNGSYDNVAVPSVTPRISKAQALTNALTAVPAKKYGWEDAFTEDFYKKQSKNLSVTLYPSPELVIYHNNSLNTYTLTYKIHIYAIQPLGDYNVFVDALTGAIAGKEQLLKMDNTPGTAATLYSGTQGITVDSYLSPVQFRLHETRSGPAGTAQIQTFNMQGGSNYDNATDFSNTSTTWTIPDGGLDVHWATERVFDFWSNVMGRNSYDGAGSTLVGFVHALLTNMGFSNNDNAFWDPTNHRITYGDGGTEMRTVVSLDVIAHEIGHGICQYTANLDNSGEAAALNEGLSDIWAACVEHYAAPAKDNWLIGEEIMLLVPSLRSLRDPINEGARPCPDTYLGPNWSTAGGSIESHINCTVLGHWFFLLCEGGAGTNIGIENAQQIVYQMERYHMDHNATYTTTRAGAIQAARELFGVNSCQEAAVTNAWFAVGVGNAYASTYYPPVTINGPISICTNQSATYTLSNVPPNAKFTWSISSPNTTIVPAADGLSAVVTNNGASANSGTSVQASYGGCPTNILSAKNVALSAPWPVGIASYANSTYCEYNDFALLAGGGSYAYNMQLYVSAFGATSYSWTELSNTGPMYWSNVSSSGVTVGSKKSTGSLILKVTASNACGSVTQQYGFQPLICNQVRMVTSPDNPNGNVTDQSLTVFPNPATDKITITLPNDLLATHAEIKISDIYGRHVQRLKTISATTTTSMLGLPSGMYIVEVITGNKTVMMKKIVKK